MDIIFCSNAMLSGVFKSQGRCSDIFRDEDICRTLTSPRPSPSLFLPLPPSPIHLAFLSLSRNCLSERLTSSVHRLTGAAKKEVEVGGKKAEYCIIPDPN